VLPIRVTESALRILDWAAVKLKRTQPSITARQKLGRRGEEAAYFYLRRAGYVFIARNFRSPHHRGEIDLIGWDHEVLCFVEVKTRTTRDVKPAEAAVDREKRRDLLAVARDYLRLLATPCSWRFDVVTVYYDLQSGEPQFELFRNVSSIS